MGRGIAATLSLARGAASYSTAFGTSAATVFNARRTPAVVTIEKWVSWQGDRFERLHAPRAAARWSAQLVIRSPDTGHRREDLRVNGVRVRSRHRYISWEPWSVW